MTEQEVREALARAEAATPGPWGVGRHHAQIHADNNPRCHVAETSRTELWDGGPGRQRENAAFIAAARQDVPALCREYLALCEWRAVWEQDSGYHEGAMAERRRVLAIIKDMAERRGGDPMYNILAPLIGPAPDNLPALPPDRTREYLARAVELLSSWVCIRQPDLGRLTCATVELLKEVE